MFTNLLWTRFTIKMPHNSKFMKILLNKLYNPFQKLFNNKIMIILKGFNATIMAYGQTGTGKTHTMEGLS